MELPQSAHQPQGSVPIHTIHQLIGRTTMHPELKELLSKRMVSHVHGHSLAAHEIDTIFSELKMQRAGSADAVHLDRLHKSITEHLPGHGEAPAGEHPHPYLPGH